MRKFLLLARGNREYHAQWQHAAATLGGQAPCPKGNRISLSEAAPASALTMPKIAFVSPIRSACVEEIRAVIGGITGVAAVSLAKHGDTSGIAVQFDPEATTIQDHLKAFRKLPSFYRGFFEPTVLEDWSPGSL